MSDVKRYWIKSEPDGHDIKPFKEDTDGLWNDNVVLASDYDALAAELAEAKRQATQLRAQYVDCDIEQGYWIKA